MGSLSEKVHPVGVKVHETLLGTTGKEDMDEETKGLLAGIDAATSRLDRRGWDVDLHPHPQPADCKCGGSDCWDGEQVVGCELIPRTSGARERLAALLMGEAMVLDHTVRAHISYGRPCAMAKVPDDASGQDVADALIAAMNALNMLVSAGPHVEPRRVGRVNRMRRPR